VPRLLDLKIDKETIRKFYDDSLEMLNGFLGRFVSELSSALNGSSIEEAFNKLKPQREVYLTSERYKIQGYLDAIYNNPKGVSIFDYKTSRRDEMSKEYKLQLAIYSLLYKETFNVLPSVVGIYFLRHGTDKVLDVDDSLISLATNACLDIQTKTVSDDIADYPRDLGPLCKWKGGACDFYDTCFGQEKLSDFESEE